MNSQHLGLAAAFVLSLPGAALAQQLGMFPPGPYVVHCIAAQTNINHGGDDDHNNMWYFAVDPQLADGTPAADFFIHLFDGDNNAITASTGTQDHDLYAQASQSVFEYRLYGGVGAANNDEMPPGQDPVSWSGVLIDIDSDAGDDTLRTDDPDDIDDNSPEDLRDQGYSLIAIDMDANPGDLVNGFRVYKFVVDGTAGPGGEWNRYEILATADAGRTDAGGIQMYVYELTYAGRPSTSQVWTNLGFRVPVTPNDQLDLQTLDMDRHSVAAASRLTTPSALYGNSVMFESGDQYTGGQWRWSSVNQQVSVAAGNGQTGLTYPSVGEAGLIWVYDADPATATNPFSVRLMDSQGGWLPMFVDPVFTIYGSGPLGHYGAGLPKPGGASITLFGENAPANSFGAILFGPSPDNSVLSVPPYNVQLYVNLGFATSDAFPFDGNGDWTTTFPVPAGLVPGSFYGQVFALDIAQNQVLHSNGLAIRIVP